MNNIRYTKAIALIILWICCFINVNAQNDLVIKIKVKVDANACFTCNHRPIKKVNLCLKDADRTEVTKIIFDGVGGNYYPYNQWRYKTVAISSSQDYVLRWYDSANKKWKEEDLKKSLDTNQEINYHGKNSGIRWYSVWMDAIIETYDPVSITDVEFTPCISSDCGKPLQCIDNIDGELKFSLFVVNKSGPKSMYIEALDSKNTVIGSEYISKYNSTISIPFSSLNLQNYLGRDIWFKVKTDYGSGAPSVYLYKKTSFSRRFFKQMTAPTGSITSERKACDPKIIIKVPLASNVIKDINTYKFRVIKGDGKNEDVSQVVRLVPYGSITGNVLRLVPEPNDEGIIIGASGKHTLQIFESTQDVNENTSFPSVQCAVIRYFDLDPVKEPIKIESATASTKINSSYHTSRHNTLDAKVNLNVNSWERVSRVELDYECNFESSCLDNCSDCNVVEDITSKLKNVNGNIRSFESDFKIKQIYFRIKDTDGCVSNISNVTLHQPPPFVFSQPESSSITKVQCHKDNSLANQEEKPFNKYNNGSIALSFSGGIPEYSISVDGDEIYNKLNETNLLVSGLSEGTHSVRVYNSFGDGITRSVYVGQNEKLTFDIEHNPIKCFDANTNITINAQNNNGPTTKYTLYQDGEVNEQKFTKVFSSKTAGNYTMQVSSDGCIAQADFTVNQPSEITINATGSKVAKFGANTGTINFSISGGTGNYTFTLSNGSKGTTSKSGSIKNLFAGYYDLEVTDDNGCSKTQLDIYVQQPLAPLEISFSKPHRSIDCFGNATGEVYPIATGGWPPYKYGVNKVVIGSANKISGLTGDVEHKVFVVDDLGVVIETNVVITQPRAPLSTSIDNINNLQCFEDNSGAVKLKISGGTGDYRVSLDNLSWTDGNSLVNLPIMANETVYVLDANNCPAQVNNITITQPSLLVSDVNTVHNLLCFDDGTGAIKLNIDGGTSPYAMSVDELNWVAGNSIESLQANPAQKVWVKDSHGCKNSLVTNITQPDRLDMNPNVYHLNCYEDNLGAIKMDVLGGTWPYSISVDSLNWFIGDSISGLSANSNQPVFIKDEHNCLTKKILTINQPDELISQIDSVFHLKCYNDGSGAVELNIKGGTAPYSISQNESNWYSGNYIDNLYANPKLTLFVKDKNNCKITKQVEISQPIELSANVDEVFNLRCFDDYSGAVKLNINGGTTPYMLSSDKTIWTFEKNLSNLPANDATAIYIKDGHNCNVVLTTTITQPKALVAKIDTVIAAYCNKQNGAISISTKGGTISEDYKYLWQKTGSKDILSINETLSNIYSGQYKLIVTDDNLCVDSLNIPVSDMDGPVLNLWHADPVTCNNGKDGVLYVDSVSGGGGMYRYYLNDDEFLGKVSDLSFGTYHLKITDNKDCVANNFLNVPQPDTLGYDLVAVEPSCYGMDDGKLSVFLKGGNGNYTAIWADGSSSMYLNNISSGIYPLAVSDIKGCYNKFNIVLPQPDKLSIHSELVNPLCNNSSDGRILCTPQGGNPGYACIWSTGARGKNLYQLGTGNYSLKVWDSKGCTADTSFVIEAPERIRISPVVSNPICFGDANGTIQSNVTGGVGEYVYSWSTGSKIPNINGLRKGNFSLEVRDFNNCQFSEKFSLVEPNKLAINSSVVEPSCYGYKDGSISITALGGNGIYSYLWNTNDNTSTLSELTLGTYNLQVTDKNNCILQKTFSLNQPSPIIVNGNIKNPTCHDGKNGSILAKSTGGNGVYIYNWDSNFKGKYLPNIGKGTYNIKVTDTNNCVGRKTFTLEAPMPPTAHLDQNVGILCTGNTIELDGGSFTSYKWLKDGNFVSYKRKITVGQTGLYTLKIQDEKGCVGIDTFNLKVSDSPLDAALLVQDNAYVNEVIEAIDVTWPIPDNIEWFFDHPVALADNNAWSQQFSSTTEGIINVKLRAWYGGCFSDFSKTVTIINEDGYMPQKSAMYQPLILGYKAYPNPNDGNFYIGVELSRKADISLHLYSVGSTGSVDIQKYNGLNRYEIPYNLTSLVPGVYIIVLSAEMEQQRLKIIID